MMSMYRDPYTRASETVMFRLTLDEKRLLVHLAGLEEMTLTDLFRGMLHRRAGEMGVFEIPPPPPQRGPGRPRKKRDEATAQPGGVVRAIAQQRRYRETGPAVPPEVELSPGGDVVTFGDLVDGFEDHTSGREEGIRRDIGETMRLVMSRSGTGGPIISGDLPVCDITDETLNVVRERIRGADLRFPKKNLCLHYLRMMFQWGRKDPLFTLRLDSTEILPPLTAREVADAWPAPGQDTRE